jgi:bacterial/archaeal transporter family protein
MTPPPNRRWLFYCLLAILMWGVWGIISKAATKVASDATILVISTLGVLPAGLVLLLSKNLKQGRNLPLGCAYAFATGVCGSTGNLLMLQSLSSGGDASIVLPLTGMFPLATVILAVLILKERLNGVQVAGIALALGALYLFNAADPAASGKAGLWASLAAPWMRSALGALLLWGLAGVLQKLATDQISAELSTLCFTVAFIPVAGVVAMMFQVQWPLPSTQAWLLVLLFGAFIGFGTLVLFAAYRDGKASIVTPVYALYPAVTVLLAVPIFQEKIDVWRAAGIALALVAAIALSHETPEAPPVIAAPEPSP